jgi:transposase
MLTIEPSEPLPTPLPVPTTHQDDWCLDVVHRAQRCSPRFDAVALHIFSGLEVEAVARQLRRSEAFVVKWCDRYLRLGLEGLEDSARPGRPRKLSDDEAAEKLSESLRRHLVEPGDGCITTRALAKELNISQPTVSRLLRRLGLNAQVRATLPGLEFAADRAGELLAVVVSPRAQVLALALDDLPAVLRPTAEGRAMASPPPPSEEASALLAELGDLRVAVNERWPRSRAAKPPKGPPPPWSALRARLIAASHSLPAGRRLHLIVGGRLPASAIPDEKERQGGALRLHAPLSLKLWRDQLARALEASAMAPPDEKRARSVRSFVEAMHAEPISMEGAYFSWLGPDRVARGCTEVGSELHQPNGAFDS